MKRLFSIARLLVAAVCLGLLCTLPACGLLGGNDDGDDGKFPEPPDRPSSAQVVTPASGPDPMLAVTARTEVSIPIQTPLLPQS